ncbi:MAG TPA: lactonase family protein [Asticcacaulis sp.]|nr:lactonase family protein [Asticcacaulis sp.]
MSRTTKRDLPGIDRRLFMAGAAAVLGAPAVANAANGEYMFYVGAMNTSGLVTLTYSPAYDTWTQGKVQAGVAPNASFGAYSPRFKRHYIVNEQDNGAIGVYQANGNGKMTLKGQVSSHGSNPCYISLDGTESYLAVANYNTGDIAVYALDKTGLPVEPATIKQNTGKGYIPDRQDGPHAHWVQFSKDQKFIYSVDLGTDQILGYPFNAGTGAVGDPFVAFKADPGFGPRHMILHPGGQVAYILGELSNAVITLRPQADGTFTGVQWTSTVPADFTGHSQAAHISLNKNGDRLYISNRGHNSLCVLGMDQAGRLVLMQIIPTGGDWPRHFRVLDNSDRIVVANQNSGNLTVFGMHLDGTLKPIDAKLNVPNAVFIGELASS